MATAAVFCVVVGLLMAGCGTEERDGLQNTSGDGPTIVLPDYGELRLSEAGTCKNLTVFLLVSGGASPRTSSDYLTLEEGLRRKVATVSEKESADVSTLQVVNRSEKPIFIQAGDIVKGGQQDRTIQVSLVIPPKSGPIDIPSLCVEPHRWTGGEKFDAAETKAASKEMKIAIQKGDQGKVWESVAEFKEKARDVTGGESQTSSVNEELEHARLTALVKEYLDTLGSLPDTHPEAVGAAFVVNGELSAIELYGDPALFRMSFPRLLEASAREAAVSGGAAFSPIEAGAIVEFLNAMEKGDTNEERIEENRVLRLENEKGFWAGVTDSDKKVIHREYLTK